MKKREKISVLMAVHNAIEPSHLNEALASLYGQTQRPDQIVLVEDGPLNRELKHTIDRWHNIWHRRLTRLRNRKNRGLTKSLNRGLQRAQHPLIARMDSDDIAHPRRFERQAKFLAHNKDVAIVGGTIEEIDGCGTISIRHYPATHDEVVLSIHRASPLAHPAVMMRREIFLHGLHYDERYRTSQDIALWFDAICAGYRIANLRDTVLYFRIDDKTLCRRGYRKAWNEFRIYCSGIRRLHGFWSWRYIYPVCRLVARLMPTAIIRRLYRSRLRHALVK